jgi:serine/threonine protein kinase
VATLPSRYELVDTEGAGGFGRVVHAKDTWLERDIAIKILDPLMALEDQERKRFQLEARVLAALSHPNIPAIYDVVFEEAGEGEDGEAHFQIIFEYIRGRTLKDHLREDGPVTLEDARAWFPQLCSALQHAHERDIIHRDVKPANIIVRTEGDSCCLVDFGIALTASEAERLTKSGYVIGTPGYMSPEQEAGEELDGRTDVYNLGICLYEALAGIPLARGAYKPIAAINEGTPPAIDELIQECLESRDMRLESPELFSKRLAEALRPKASLASVLSEGRLADLQGALAEMNPAEYGERPAGQRALIMSRVADLAVSDNERLELPVVNLLHHLIHLGTRLPPEEYEEIVDLGLVWGFDHQYENGDVGKARLRRALGEEVATLTPSLHAMVASKVLQFFEEKDLGSLDEAHLNGARDLVSNLLANRACEADAPPLAELRREIDAEHRSRR